MGDCTKGHNLKEITTGKSTELCRPERDRGQGRPIFGCPYVIEYDFIVPRLDTISMNAVSTLTLSG